MTDGGRRVVLRAGGASDVGRARTVNEDRVLVGDGLYAVADGMGGHAAGEVASRLAVEALQVSAGRTTDELVAAVKVANQAVIQHGERDPATRGMGTTLCAVALVDTEPEPGAGGPGGRDAERIAVANVGDSRVYLFQGGELLQLTEDHSLVEDMVREGQLSAEEARVHPGRNIVTRVLGNEPDVDVDVWEVDVRTGDRYLLCSDGLFNELDDDRIAAALRRLDDPEDAATELVRLANAAGGRDNISVVVVDVVDDAGRSEAAAAAVTPTARDRRRVAAPGDAAEEGADDRADDRAGGAAPRPGGGRDTSAARGRRVTWRTVAFVVAVAAVVAAGFGAVTWYGRNGWFVGLDGDRVAVYRGRPGGVLWIEPVVEQRTRLTRADVPPARLDDVRDGKEVASRAAADRFVENLEEEAKALGLGDSPPTTAATAVTAAGAPSSTSTTSTTATTAP